MRSFARIVRPMRPFAIRTAQPTQFRAFTQAPQLRLKEDKPANPEEAERVKQEQLEKQKQGKGHWHEELASQSESHVAADRESVGSHDKHMEDLQKETAESSEKNHPKGKKD